MTIDPAPSAGLTPAPTQTADGRTMIGHVVVCLGRNESDEPAVAVWHVNTAGTSVGAWVLPFDPAAPDPVVARTVLQLCLRRAVTAWDPAHTAVSLAEFEQAAHVEASPWLESAIALPELLDDISLTRSAYEKWTAAEQQVKKSVVAIEWPVDLPEHLATTAEGLSRQIRLTLPETSPVGRDALLLSNLVGWAVQRWQESMTMLRRRRFLLREFGRPTQLSPRWETRLADAYADNRRLRPRLMWSILRVSCSR
jgi:hypothetical protein